MTTKIQKIILRKKNPPVAMRLQQPAVSSQCVNGMSQPPKKSVVDHRAHGDHVGVLGDEEQRELHRAVLGVIPGDQLRLGLRQVERHPVGLGESGDQEDEERKEQGQDEPEAGLLLRR